MLGSALIPLSIEDDLAHSFCALGLQELQQIKSLRILGDSAPSKIVAVLDRVETYTYERVDAARLVVHLNRHLAFPLKNVANGLYVRRDLLAQITTIRDARKRTACLSALTPIFATESEHEVCFATVEDNPRTVAGRLAEFGVHMVRCSLDERACYVNPKAVRVVMVADLLDASMHAQQLLLVSVEEFDAVSAALGFAQLCTGCAVDTDYLTSLKRLRGVSTGAELAFADIVLRLPVDAEDLMRSINVINELSVREKIKQRLLPVPLEIEDQVLQYVYGMPAEALETPENATNDDVEDVPEIII
jgi:hypothetical protein